MLGLGAGSVGWGAGAEGWSSGLGAASCFPGLQVLLLWSLEPAVCGGYGCWSGRRATLCRKSWPILDQGSHPRCHGLSHGEDAPGDCPLQPGLTASEQSWGASGRQPGVRSPAHGGVNIPTPSLASQTTDAQQQSLCGLDHPAGAIILGKFAFPLSGDKISVFYTKFSVCRLDSSFF